MMRRLFAVGATALVLASGPDGCPPDTKPEPPVSQQHSLEIHRASQPPLRTLAEWWYDGGQLIVLRLQNDLKLLRGHNPANCVEVSHAYIAAKTFPPVPDTNLQTFWRDILSSVASQVRSCDIQPLESIDAFTRAIQRRLR
jgi:hypothetical protein